MTPAPAYAPAAGLHLVTCHFNPEGFQSNRDNYRRFRAPIDRAGLPLLTVEAVFGDAPFDLPPGPDVLQVRGRDVMWQKERLLNVALSRLPAGWTKAVWLDADVLFADPEWAVKTAARLDSFPVVQPFDTAVRLPAGTDIDDGRGDRYPSFAAVYARSPQRLLTGDFAAHGHTGFAWAARREVLESGLYDAAVAGSGDHLMAHAFAGDWQSACVDRMVGTANRQRDFFARWAETVYKRVRARVGCVPGTLLHLWHGEVSNRRYVDRNRELVGFGFDPAADLKVGASGCWEWASRKPQLHAWARAYFAGRKEDG